MNRITEGHHQPVNLSPVSAISDIVAPVVLITLATILGNGLMIAGTGVTDRISALNRERLGILRGPHGEMLDESSVPAVDRVPGAGAGHRRGSRGIRWHRHGDRPAGQVG